MDEDYLIPFVPDTDDDDESSSLSGYVVTMVVRMAIDAESAEEAEEIAREIIYDQEAVTDIDDVEVEEM